MNFEKLVLEERWFLKSGESKGTEFKKQQQITHVQSNRQGKEES